MNELEYNIYIREKNNGLQVVVNYKDGLKWKQKSKQGFPNTRDGKKEAKLHADKIIRDLKKEINLVKTKGILTFKDFKDMYLDHIKVHLVNNSIDSHEVAYKRFKQLNDIELKKITTIDIQTIVDEMIEEGLKISSIKTYLRHIISMLNYAKENNYIIKNPANKVKMPKEKQTTEKTALTTEEYDLLLSSITNKKIYFITLIAGMCGLRIGEIMGLTWNDIDFENNVINVDKQWIMDKTTKKYGFGDLKSPNSYRKVPMPKEVIEFLANSRSDDLKKRILDYKNTISISSTLIKHYINKGFDISVHELRHTYATRLVQSKKIDFKSIATLLGHDMEMLIRVYSHNTKEMIKDASNAINEIF